MHPAFSDPAPERSRDTEITLGPGLILALLLFILIFGSLCFGAGFMVAHRSDSAAISPVAASLNGTATQPATTSAQSKPSAINPALPQANPADDTANAATNPASAIPEEVGADIPDSAPIQPRHSAANSANQYRETEPSTAGIMVQVAAVAHAEDADVLSRALRKRGYAVAIHRDPTDGLLHVRLGPFATRSDAAITRQRLLDDGYNAVIQQ